MTKRKSPIKEKLEIATTYLPPDSGKNRFTHMFLEDIPTSLDDVKKKEKEWEGFERALKNIGLNKRSTKT